MKNLKISSNIYRLQRLQITILTIKNQCHRTYSLIKMQINEKVNNIRKNFKVWKFLENWAL